MATLASLELRVGVGVTQITPPLDVGLLMSSVNRAWAPFEGVRLPLEARAVVLEQGNVRVGMVALDLLGLAGAAVGGFDAFKARITANGLLDPDELILVSTHTHTGPESIALSDLYHTAAFKGWVGDLERRIAEAVGQAAGNMRPCRLGVAAGEAAGLGIHRRIKTTRGILLSHPPVPEEIILSRGGAVDDGVRVAAFVGEDRKPVAVLVNATCHPVHEMCMPRVSPDYPGEMCRELGRRHPGVVALFLNGAAGNINPPVVCGGSGDAAAHGRRLAEVTGELLKRLRFVEGDLRVGRSCFDLPAVTSGGPGVPVRLAGWSMGEAAWVFVPGEVFVEIGLAALAGSAFEFTGFAGYAEDYIGYVPTDAAFEEGGYEVGPGDWARVGRGSEGIVGCEVGRLLERLRGADLRTAKV